MAIDQATAEFVTGMQNIEREILAGLRETGFIVDANNFRWNRGAPFIPPPEAITLETVVRGHPMNVGFSREQVEDCHGGVDRRDVANLIRLIVRDLAARAA